MKVLAFNSSPNMAKGGTALILAPFLAGLKKAGAEVELFYLRQLNIKPCLGCFACWFKTPGQCTLRDDMDMLYPKISSADITVIATPVYVDGMTGTMKTLFDRFVPLVEPFFEMRAGHCRHPQREGYKEGKVVLVSVTGFPELDNFDPLVTHVKAICKNMQQEFAGALLRPYAAALPSMEKMGIPVQEVYQAAENAGYYLAKEGKMPAEDLTAVSCELVPPEAYVEFINKRFHKALATLEEKKKKKVAAHCDQCALKS